MLPLMSLTKPFFMTAQLQLYIYLNLQNSRIIPTLLLYCSRCLTVKILTVSAVVLFTMPDGKDLTGICYCTVHAA